MIDDIEIVESASDLQIKLMQLQAVRQKEHESKSEEMCLLLNEMDSVLKEKSDSERSYNAVRRKMERSLQDCQDIIDGLSRDLKASERALLKVRGDLLLSQDRCAQMDDRYAKMVTSNQAEKASLNEKVKELIEKYSQLQEICDDERQKSKTNDYLKQYVSYLEVQLKTEKLKNKQIGLKEAVIEQLKADHELALVAFKVEQEEVMRKLREEHKAVIAEIHKAAEEQQKLKTALVAVAAVQTCCQQSVQRKKLLCICASQSQSSSESEGEGEDYENQVAQIKQKAIMSEESTSTNSMEESQSEVIKRLQKEIEEYENLVRTIDVDTYLNQIENQVDEMHLRDLIQPRNDILKKQLDQTLRGIRQLCDYHNIEMEYTI